MTTTHPISRYPVPQLADLPPDIRERILAVQEKSGFIPNVFLVLAHRLDEWRAFFAYYPTFKGYWQRRTIFRCDLALRSTQTLSLVRKCFSYCRFSPSRNSGVGSRSLWVLELRI